MKYLTLTEYDLKNMETVLEEEKEQVEQARETSSWPDGELHQMLKLEGAIDFIRYTLKGKLKEPVL